MKWIHILLVAMLMCSIGIASAANDTDITTDDTGVVIGGIVDMNKVKASGSTFWDMANKDSDAGYLLLGICFVAWVVIVMYAAFGGSADYAVGKETQNADSTKSGKDKLGRVLVAIVAPIILVIVLGIFAGLV